MNLTKALGLLMLSVSALGLTASDAGGRGKLGVPPKNGTCPASHPVRGNFTTYSGEPCIYHVQGGQFYERTRPERCYASEEEARQDGCRRSKR